MDAPDSQVWRQTERCSLHQSRKNGRLGKSLVSFRKHQIISVFSPLGSHHNNLSHHTYPSPPSLRTIFLFCSFSVVPASSQEFSLAAGSTENHRLSPKTHKVPRKTRSAINYLKLKSPSAWRWKRPLRPSTAPSERTDGGMGKALRSPCRGEERGTGRRRLIWRDRGR